MEYLAGDKKFKSTTYSSLDIETEPLVAMETYILPQTIKQIGITDTVHHITGRALVCITQDNKVYTIRDTFYSARRTYPPIAGAPEKDFMTKLKEELDEVDKPKPIVLKHEMYPKYDPVIGQNNRKYLSYDLELFGLENLQTFGTRLESTTQVFVYGHDLFFARTKPDMGFDLLDEDFNFYALFAFITALIVGDYLFSKFLKKQALIKSFLTH